MDEVIRAKRQSRRLRHARDNNSRRARAQSQERRLEIPRDKLVVFTGPVGLRQVLARLRHHLCRGPAPLCRIAVGLCAPVPGDDAEARRRPDRRAVAGHFHRAEDDLEKSALDRRHRDRDLRLHAAAVGPRRRALFARHGLPIESQIVSQMVDRVLALPEGTGSICWRPWCAAARANTARNSPNTSRRDSSASRSTAPSMSFRKPPPRQEISA